MKFILVSLVLAMGIAANAGTKKKNTVKTAAVTVTPAPVFNEIVLDDNYYNAAIKESKKRATRNVAQADSSQEEAMLSTEYKNLRSELIGGPVYENGKETSKSFKGIQTADELDAFVMRLENEYSKLTAEDAKLMAIQLRSMIPFKGIIFRAKDFYGRSTIMRSGVLTALRSTIVGINMYLPTTQWKAGFGYMTEPFASAIGSAKMISNDSHMESFLKNELLPHVYKLHADLVNLVRSNKAPIYYDNKVYLAFANFSDSNDRYLKIDRAELNLMAGASAASLASIYGATAYSLNGFSEAVQDLSKLIGVDTVAMGNIISSPADGVSAYNRFKVMKKYPNLFVLNSDGASRMSSAFQAYKASARYARIAWEEVQKAHPDASKSRNAIDPQAVMPFSRILTTAIGGGSSSGNTLNAFEGKGLNSAVVNGETVTFNMQAFFENPPKRMSDFYPVSFESAANSNQDKAKVINGKSVSYRNYLAGSANKWSCAPYKTYFPDLKCDGGFTVDVARQSRVLSQAWGGIMFGAPIAAALF